MLGSLYFSTTVVQNRKYLKRISTSATITKQPFYIFTLLIGYKELYKHTCLLPIPEAINNYNYYIGRVNIADQLQARFSTQQYKIKL
jgi:hypothetical protein